MPALYRRRPEVVRAVQWFPDRGIPGVKKCWAKDRDGKRRHYFAVETTIGTVQICPGAWILTGEDGGKSVLGDDWFRVGYEPLTD